MFKRLRQRLCSHGHGRYVIGNVCTICYKKLGETPTDRFIRETETLEELQHSLIIGDEDRQREARRQLQQNNND